MLDELPRSLVKLESAINQRFQPPKFAYKNNSFVLGPYELGKDFYYYGQWFRGQRHGIGKLYFPDKSAYYGEFVNDKAEGTGRLYHPNGDIYIG